MFTGKVHNPEILETEAVKPKASIEHMTTRGNTWVRKVQDKQVILRISVIGSTSLRAALRMA